MTEEFVTRAVLDWLKSNGWAIVSFDWPGSGTGRPIHPNENLRIAKAEGSIIPDIVATKDKTAAIFENKVRFDRGDIGNLLKLRDGCSHSDSLARVFGGAAPDIAIGIALADSPGNRAAIERHIHDIDFSMLIDESGMIILRHCREGFSFVQ